MLHLCLHLWYYRIQICFFIFHLQILDLLDFESCDKTTCVALYCDSGSQNHPLNIHSLFVCLSHLFLHFIIILLHLSHRFVLLHSEQFNQTFLSFNLLSQKGWIYLRNLILSNYRIWVQNGLFISLDYLIGMFWGPSFGWVTWKGL